MKGFKRSVSEIQELFLLKNKFGILIASLHVIFCLYILVIVSLRLNCTYFFIMEKKFQPFTISCIQLYRLENNKHSPKKQKQGRS
jgi:hypothetical protein